MTESIASLERQTCRSWEAMIIDDGSTDDTAAVLQRALATDPRIRYVRQPHAGPSRARNHGLRLVRGRYVQFLDADDLLEGSKLDHHAAILDSHTDVAIVYGDARYFDSDQPSRLRHAMDSDTPWIPRVSGANGALRALLRGNIMPVNSAMTRRRLLLDVGGFDESLPSCEDWDLWLRCAIAGANFVHADAPDTRALVRVHRTSLSNNSALMAEAAARIRQQLEHRALSSPILRDALTEIRREWDERLAAAGRELEGLLPRSARLILVDEDHLADSRSRLAATVLPFVEREGTYWGPPTDDGEAVRELNRLRDVGATWIAFTFNAFWWLDYYPGLRTHLNLCSRLVHSSHLLRVYEFTAQRRA